MNEFIQQCRNAIGASYVLTDKEDTFAYEQEWRQRLRGNALAVLRPASTQEVATLINICKTFSVSVVPQGGNTGLVLGSIPDASGKSVVLSLKRLNKIRAIDTANNTLTAEAGCLLSQVQQAAAKLDRLYPLSLASEGSCTVGGNLSTNAGGTAVLRYGNARDLCLGLEVVTANGDIWDGLRGLRKDNTGYDLRDLFIGAEGTLGVITAATLKLYPAPVANMTIMVALESPEAALLLLNEASKKLGPTLTGFELISRICLQLVIKNIPHQSDPLTQQYPYYVLLETSEHQSAELATVFIRDFLEAQLNQGHILDAVLAENMSQANALWSLRENISMAQATEGKNIKHDISVPISSIPAFIATTNQLLAHHFAGSRVVCFGHMGDGNLHYNVSPADGQSADVFIQNQEAVNRLVHDQVHHFHGSISAEHGLGALKREEIQRYKSLIEMNLMRSIKQALDPHNLMNPGKII
ncbi:MAG: FAD-binding oxidoreductase [Burkholderiaceae bacterium]|nr:FAD-binding oxidoreductase [Burkholderiaceae bacterium]